MTIKYFTRSNWGNIHLYILDESIAYSISILTGKKTIDKRDIEALKKLGFSFELVLDPDLVIA